MRGTLLVVAAIVVAVLILVIVDLVSTPTVEEGDCVLDVEILLPDTCVGPCDPLFGCVPWETRPYLLFFEQAASCPDICVQLP